MYFACLFCARRGVRTMKTRTLNGPLDTSMVWFFIGVQWLDSNFNVEVSRGPFRISTLRCPEVRLEFQL